INLLTQEYEKFSISNEETIDSGFTRFNAIVTSIKSLDPDYSSKNHVRKFLCALPLKWRAKVTAIEETKDLATLPLDELIKNLKVYKMVLDNDRAGSKTTKEKVKSLALKAKITREQTGDDSDSQGGSDEDIDEEESEAFNLLARNFRKFFRNGKRLKQKGACYNCGIEGHFASECRKPKENKAFVGRAWSDSEDGDEHQNDATCLMVIDSQELCFKYDLRPDDWIVNSGCTKHMTENRRLFTSYKAYDGGHVVFESNLKGKVVGGGNITHDSIIITNVDHVSGLAFNLIIIESKDDVLDKFKILCKRLENLHDIVSIVTNHSSEFDKLKFGSFCEQHGMSYNLSGPLTSQSNEIVERTHRKLRKMSRAIYQFNFQGKQCTLVSTSLSMVCVKYSLEDHSSYIKVSKSAQDTDIGLVGTCFRDFAKRESMKKAFQDMLHVGGKLIQHMHITIVPEQVKTKRIQVGVQVMKTRRQRRHPQHYKHLGRLYFVIFVLVRNIFDPKSYEDVFLGYSQTSKAYIVLNKETIRIEESLNVTFDESFPEPKSSPSVEDDRIDEPIVQDLNGSPSLQVNVSDEGYPKSLKEARGHPIKQVIGELNERTLRSKNKQA
ncbi:retrovirus-related pol polyprotein from transposon TNT 1-94, partial [Tanacetum coccineum]